MTAANKLRDLPHDEWPTDAVTAVIEAAEQYLAAPLDRYGIANDEPIADALAALNARLDGAA